MKGYKLEWNEKTRSTNLVKIETKRWKEILTGIAFVITLTIIILLLALVSV